MASDWGRYGSSPHHRPVTAGRLSSQPRTAGVPSVPGGRRSAQEDAQLAERNLVRAVAAGLRGPRVKLRSECRTGPRMGMTLLSPATSGQTPLTRWALGRSCAHCHDLQMATPPCVGPSRIQLGVPRGIDLTHSGARGTARSDRFMLPDDLHASSTLAVEQSPTPCLPGGALSFEYAVSPEGIRDLSSSSRRALQTHSTRRPGGWRVGRLALSRGTCARPTFVQNHLGSYCSQLGTVIRRDVLSDPLRCEYTP